MNQEYKSDVFSMLLQYQENALDIYNALNETSYDDPSKIVIQTLPSGISLTVRNDASFIIDSYMNVYEHQSTFNPNMPLRNLLYIAKLLKEYVKEQNLYSRKLIKLPNIRCVVFYNGSEPQPEVRELRLSDAYIHNDDDPDVEIKCTVYNINKGHNQKLLKACKVLNGYMCFVDKARTYLNSPMFSGNPEEALYQAIDHCIENGVLADFFTERREEILKIVMLDWTYEHRYEIELKEGIEEGVEEGIKERIKESIKERTEIAARGIILMGRELNASDDFILTHLQQALSIGPEEAENYLKMCTD